MKNPCIKPLRRSLPIEKNFKSTPPLRGSRRAKGVSPQAIRWGDIPQSKPPPTDSTFAQTARLHRLPLKGGVKSPPHRLAPYAELRNQGFLAAPLRPGSIPRLPSGSPSLARAERISPHLRRGAHHALPASGRNSLRFVRNRPAFARVCRPRGFGGFRYDGEAGRFVRKYRISIKFNKYR